MKLINPDRKHNENDIPDDTIPDRSIDKPPYTPSYREIAKKHSKKNIKSTNP